MYIQYFSKKDFSFGGSTGLPSAVTGGGTRSAGLHEAGVGRGIGSRAAPQREREGSSASAPCTRNIAGREMKHGTAKGAANGRGE